HVARCFAVLATSCQGRGHRTSRRTRPPGNAKREVNLMRTYFTAALLLALLVSPVCFADSPTQESKPRVMVLTDIGNEPDDSESMVRFLLYSNEFDVEGLLAVTSTWLRTVVHPEMIEERVRAYGQVLPNLRAHASGYPDMEPLLKRIHPGRPEYGMSG